MTPKISICLPTYDRVQHLREAINSISNNLSRDHVEVVISDNKPTDDTRAVIEEYNSLPIRYYSNRTNIGVIKNLFRVISLARGNYVWLFSDDDALIDGAIEYLEEFISNHPDVDYIFFPRILVDRNFRPVTHDTQPSGISADMLFSSGKDLFSALDGQMTGILGYFCSTIIRRDLWEKYCTRLGEPYGGFHHLRVILMAIRRSKCAILGKPGVFCRLGNFRENSSRIWFDEYIGVFQFAKELGYSNCLCDSAIQRLIRSFSKMFVVDKAKGHRSDNILSALAKLDVLGLKVKKQPWYLLSFLPVRLLNPMMSTYFTFRSLLWHRRIV